MIITENIVARGRISALVERPNRGMHGPPVYEYAERPPGVRILVVHDGSLLLQREWRDEHRKVDLRLPGGKVFDTFAEYEPWRGDEAGLTRCAGEAARKELYEETTLHLKNDLFQLHRIDECGATVRWRLYFFEVYPTRPSKLPPRVETQEGERTEPTWMSPPDLLHACLAGHIGETRSVAVILQFLGRRSPQLFNTPMI